MLFEIDPLPYQAQVDMAKGKLAEAQAQVSEAKAKVAQAEAQVDVGPQPRLAIDKEVAKTTRRHQQAEVGGGRGQGQGVGGHASSNARPAVLALKASVKAAEANLEYNQLNLDWTKVKSPIAGRVDRNLLDRRETS